jgi:hypothetical protein
MAGILISASLYLLEGKIAFPSHFHSLILATLLTGILFPTNIVPLYEKYILPCMDFRNILSKPEKRRKIYAAQRR